MSQRYLGMLRVDKQLIRWERMKLSYWQVGRSQGSSLVQHLQMCWRSLPQSPIRLAEEAIISYITFPKLQQSNRGCQLQEDLVQFLLLRSSDSLLKLSEYSLVVRTKSGNGGTSAIFGLEGLLAFDVGSTAGTEIDDLGHSGAIEHDVIRFDVSVADAEVAEPGQSLDYLLQNGQLLDWSHQILIAVHFLLKSVWVVVHNDLLIPPQLLFLSSISCNPFAFHIEHRQEMAPIKLFYMHDQSFLIEKRVFRGLFVQIFTVFFGQLDLNSIRRGIFLFFQIWDSFCMDRLQEIELKNTEGQSAMRAFAFIT